MLDDPMKSNTLTYDDIQRAVKALDDANKIPQDALMLVNNANYYLSKQALFDGFDCTQEEVDNAVDGYIKTKNGVRLYLTKSL
jgi:hypothetical protein